MTNPVIGPASPRRRRRRGSTSARFSIPTRIVISVLVVWFTWWVARSTGDIIRSGRPDGVWALPVLAFTLLICATVLFSLWRPGGR